jgi:hypothetical protein
MARDRKEMHDEAWRPLRIEGIDPRSFVLPKTPFARLGLAHAVCAAGDAMVTIALAKTLFFVSPDQARSKVLLYLLLTLAPFAVVSPFIGPLVDRYSGNKRWLIVGSATARAVLCLLMSQDVTGPLLFPEAFLLLVVSKGYSVARSSLVPSVVPEENELVRANSRLALLAGIGGSAGALPGGLLSLIGARWVLTFAALVFGAGAFFASRIIVVSDGQVQRSAETDANGEQSPQSVLESDRRRTIELRLATLAMSVLRGTVGFVTFLAAFTLKRDGSSDAWLGVFGACGVIGGMVGSLAAPVARRFLQESHILWASLIGIASASLLGIFESDPLPSALVVFVVAFGAGLARLAFDSLMQRDSDVAVRGAAFARLETRFQLSWVLGALIPVALQINRSIGFAILLIVSAITIAIMVGGEASLKRIDAALDAGSAVWRKPVRVAEAEWRSTDDDL